MSAKITLGKFDDGGDPEFASADLSVNGVRVGFVERYKAGQQKSATSRAVVWVVDSYTARFDDVERPDVMASVRRDRDARRTLADLKLAVAAAFGDASAFELIEDEIEITHPLEMTV